MFLSLPLTGTLLLCAGSASVGYLTSALHDTLAPGGGRHRRTRRILPWGGAR
ncbi:hypothetical protein [Streptomyces sp. NPDC102360]|uniref:hypothetical protein n=1 Tax=Streptomyces sp. NPDC102360 TaxID=3366160 RepID=UPI0038133F94